MPETETLLKVLLREKRWQSYGMFRAEYEKAAATISTDLKSSFPSIAQYRRWLAGNLKSLPYPHHCRILEVMLPGHRAEDLFRPATPDQLAERGNGTRVTGDQATGETMRALPPIGLRPHIEAAFSARHVALDFAGFSSETLHGVLQEPLDRIRLGELRPETIEVRLLVPDASAPFSVPCRTEDLADDPDFRHRAEKILLRHAGAIIDSVQELGSLGRVTKANAAIRVHRCAPLFKLYILNREQAFFGFYPIQEHAVSINGAPHPMYDLMGKEALLFQHSGDDASGASYVEQAQLWFDSMWNTVSRDYEL
jgi:hypothetical protein